MANCVSREPPRTSSSPSLNCWPTSPPPSPSTPATWCLPERHPESARSLTEIGSPSPLQDWAFWSTPSPLNNPDFAAHDATHPPPVNQYKRYTKGAGAPQDQRPRSGVPSGPHEKLFVRGVQPPPIPRRFYAAESARTVAEIHHGGRRHRRFRGNGEIPPHRCHHQPVPHHHRRTDARLSGTCRRRPER